MGCTSSRDARRARRRSPAAYYRSQSMPVASSVGGSSRRVGDSNRHIVALTSSTLGSLRLDEDETMMKAANDAGGGLKSAKTWSEMIESRIPKTPTRTPPEPETINAWELMAGLEEAEAEAEEEEAPKLAGIVKARVTAFQKGIDARRGKKGPPGGEGKVVLYFTSLRGVRKTYEECWAARAILEGYGVRVDERDVSMHAGFKDEVSEILGQGFGLPRVFANAVHLGGAEEIRQMHERGELGKALEECEAAVLGKGGRGGGGDCEGCGGVRFVPCENCAGSCKVFVEEEEEEGGGGFRRCPDCNENGLVRCSFCW